MVNRVILLGNLGQDPELKHSQSGSAVVRLSLATSRKWKDKEGAAIEETEWHRVVVFGKTAEFAAQYLNTGSKVYVEGRLQTTKWQDKEGKDRYTTEVIAESLQNLTPRTDAGSQQQRRDEPPTTGDDIPF